MFTPSCSTLFPASATKAISTTFLHDMVVATSPPLVYLDSYGAWTSTRTGAPYFLSAESFAALHGGGTPSTAGEGWTVASGAVFRLVAVTDAAGARSGIAVMAGPSDPPPT